MKLNKLNATVALKATEQFIGDAPVRCNAEPIGCNVTLLALKATEQFVGGYKLDATSRCLFRLNNEVTKVEGLKS